MYFLILVIPSYSHVFDVITIDSVSVRVLIDTLQRNELT